jgi:hypothetical protein
MIKKSRVAPSIDDGTTPAANTTNEHHHKPPRHRGKLQQHHNGPDVRKLEGYMPESSRSVVAESPVLIRRSLGPWGVQVNQTWNGYQAGTSALTRDPRSLEWQVPRSSAGSEATSPSIHDPVDSPIDVHTTPFFP